MFVFVFLIDFAICFIIMIPAALKRSGPFSPSGSRCKKHMGLTYFYASFPTLFLSFLFCQSQNLGFAISSHYSMIQHLIQKSKDRLDLVLKTTEKRGDVL